jgi:trigger factor
LKVSKEESEQCEINLTIELDDDDLAVYIKRAYQKVAQNIKIPGFRKGKAPQNIVEREIGRSSLIRESLDFLIPEVTTKAIEDNDITPYARPEVSIDSVEPFIISAIVPLKPIVNLGDYHSVRVEEEIQKINEEDVDKVIKGYQADSIPWEPVSRTVQEGDLVVMDLKGTIESTLEPDITTNPPFIDQNNYEVIIDKANLVIPEFADSVIGMMQGENKDFTLNFDSNVPEVEFAGKPAHFSVSVKEIKERIIPELNDEFAKEIGEGYETLDALREDVRKQRTEVMEQESKRNYNEQVIDEVLKITTIITPPILIEREVDATIDNMTSEVTRQIGREITREEYLSVMSKSEEDLKKEIHPEAIKRLERSLLLDQLIEKEGIKVNDKDIQEEIDKMAGDSPKAQQIKDLFSSDEAKASLTNSIQVQKLMELLTDIGKGSVEKQTEN